MKKKGQKKGKFMDLEAKNKKVDDHKIKLSHQYETPLESLYKTFPQLLEDLIESIYEEHFRSFYSTKKYLEEISQMSHTIPSNISIQVPQILEEENNESNKNSYIDINAFVNFRYEDPFLDDNVHKNKKEDKNLLELANLKQKKLIENIEYANNLKMQQKKFTEEYQSVFEDLRAGSTPVNSIYNEKNIYDHCLDELIVDSYIDILYEFFPKFSRTQIIEKICEYDFDIDKLLISLLDDKETPSDIDFNKLECIELSEDFKTEVLCNFYAKNENDFQALFDHNLQNKIEKEIKKKKQITNVSDDPLNEEEFPYLSEEIKYDVKNSFKVSDEYFLDKEIKDIQSQKVKEDLTKLVKNFAFVDEFEIKWVYYQFMDYYETFKYFNQKSVNNEKKQIFDPKIFEKSNDYRKNKNELNNNFFEREKSRETGSLSQQNKNLTGIINKIITEPPVNWKIENNISNINVNDYQTIRQKLLLHAQIAWRKGCHQEAKVIIAKARRYKQEMNRILETKKLNLFLKNNQDNQVLNFISNKENFIDLHGLSYEESKIILNKKICDIKDRQRKGIIESNNRFTLHVVCGKGNHSKDKKAVLLPKLTAILKQNYHVKVDDNSGIIRVYI